MRGSSAYRSPASTALTVYSSGAICPSTLSCFQRLSRTGEPRLGRSRTPGRLALLPPYGVDEGADRRSKRVGQRSPHR